MISSYYYRGKTESWEFEETTLDRINLLVGASGSGKTRFLNTIFNFSNTVLKGEPFRVGYWRISVCADEYEYK